MKNRKIEFIYWFAYYNLDSPSVRYRAKYPLDSFREKNKMGSYLVIPSYTIKGIYNFLKAYISALFFRKPNSLIILQRIQSNFIYANLLKLLISVRKENTIYDLDDADYLEFNPKTLYYFVRHCDKISAGSHQIEKHLKILNNKIIQTTSPIVNLNLTKIKKNSILNIGWIGGFGGDHKKSLIEIFFPALNNVKFNCKFTILGVVRIEDINYINNYFKDKPNIAIEIPSEIDWNDENAIQNRIIKFDIGIATLIDNEMQLSKSGIKAKQYMNNGVPVLSTNLPENNIVIKEGYNGYYCNTSSEFELRLIQFNEMSNTTFMAYSKNSRETAKQFGHDNYLNELEKLKNGI